MNLRIITLLAVAACVGCASQSIVRRAFQEQPIPSYEAFQAAANCAAKNTDWIHGGELDETCIRASWEMLNAMSLNMECEADRDCGINWMFPPVGPECTVASKRWLTYRNPESRSLTKRVIAACGLIDTEGRPPCKVSCKNRRCVVEPPQYFPPLGAERCLSGVSERAVGAHSDSR